MIKDEETTLWSDGKRGVTLDVDKDCFRLFQNRYPQRMCMKRTLINDLFEYVPFEANIMLEFCEIHCNIDQNFNSQGSNVKHQFLA